MRSPASASKISITLDIRILIDAFMDLELRFPGRRVMLWDQVLSVVECHAEGEIGKVVTGGFADVPGKTMYEKMRYIEHNRDDVRKMLLHEPRGSMTHSVNIVLPSNDPNALLGYVIAESTEYPVMSGSNTICTATVILETGLMHMEEPVTSMVLESPAGLIEIHCSCRAGKVTEVSFVNQPAFAYHLGVPLEVSGLGVLTVDVAWGGMAYVIVDASAIGFSITQDEARDLCETGEVIKLAAREQLPVKHPVGQDFAGITQTEFVAPLRRRGSALTSRNTVVVTPGRLDRSPCGTGTSARLATMHARGLIGVGEEFVHESILGTRFRSKIVSTTSVGGVSAIVPEIAGRAWITEISSVGRDPSDPFPTGYELSDTWGVSSKRREDRALAFHEKL